VDHSFLVGLVDLALVEVVVVVVEVEVGEEVVHMALLLVVLLGLLLLKLEIQWFLVLLVRLRRILLRLQRHSCNHMVTEIAYGLRI